MPGADDDGGERGEKGFGVGNASESVSVRVVGLREVEGRRYVAMSKKEEIGDALEALAAEVPLLLILEDLQ